MHQAGGAGAVSYTHLNLQDRKYFLVEENKWVNLRVSTAGMRTINKIGLAEALKRARAKGYLAA